MRVPVLALSSLLLPASLFAQATAKVPDPVTTSASPQTTLTVNARLVTLPVVVRDKKGKIISGLTKDDFTLTEDGRPETIRYFTLDTNLPLTLALAVDTSGSMRDALDAERSASTSFLDTMLSQPTDKAAVLHFDREVELLEDLTSQKPKLNEALNQLGPTAAPDPDAGSSSGSNNDPNNTPRRGGTTLYDAIYLSANDILAKQPGRKAIIVLSDGEDRGSKETLMNAVEAAQKAEAEIYTIYFQGERGGNNNGNPNNGGRHGGGMGYPGGGGMGYPGGGGMGYPGGGGMGYPGGGGGNRQPRPSNEPHVDGKKVMQRIAEETGGSFYEAKKKENFADIYKQIADELRQQYMLGYTPDSASQGDGFHRIALTTKKKDLFVQTRAGYYSGGSSGK